MSRLLVLARCGLWCGSSFHERQRYYVRLDSCISLSTQRNQVATSRWFKADLVYLSPVGITPEKRAAANSFDLPGQLTLGYGYAIAHGTASRNAAADFKPKGILSEAKEDNFARFDAKAFSKLLLKMESCLS
jgi:hypothetical protein